MVGEYAHPTKLIDASRGAAWVGPSVSVCRAHLCRMGVLAHREVEQLSLLVVGEYAHPTKLQNFSEDGDLHQYRGEGIA